jgi:hypothetical protein
MIYKLRMSGTQYVELSEHFLASTQPAPTVLALCGKHTSAHVQALCVRELHKLPSTDPSQRELLRSISERSAAHGLGVVAFRHASECVAGVRLPPEDASFAVPQVVNAIVGVLEDGHLEGRRLSSCGNDGPIDLISVAGDDLHFWFPDQVKNGRDPDFRQRFDQAFGAYTTDLLSRLSVAVVGCSGTGSLVVEQLVRSGVGYLVLVDPDHVEEKNLNRIVNTTADDAKLGRNKVDVAADAVARMGLGAFVEAIPHNLMNPRAVRQVASCDVLFGCVDGAEGRFLMNKLASFYSMPYIDVGVRLDADGRGGINQICGTVHYLRPGGSSLVSRGVITMDAVEAEGLKRTNPEAYKSQLKSKYIIGVQEDRPAVISVNMHYASLAVIELLARLHPFRVEGNAPFAQFGSSLTDPRFEPMLPDGDPCRILAKHIGRGDTVPLLDNPSLSEECEAA